MSELAAAPREIADCAGPRGLPLLGNPHQLDLTRLSAVLEGWADQYGPLYRIRMGRRDALVVADVEAVNTMLRQRPDGYRRRPLSAIESVLAELGITGAFSAEGEQWRRLQRLAMQSLHADYLRRYFDTVARVTTRLHERWTRAAATATATDVDVDVDVQQDMMRYAVEPDERHGPGGEPLPAGTFRRRPGNHRPAAITLCGVRNIRNDMGALRTGSFDDYSP